MKTPFIWNQPNYFIFCSAEKIHNTPTGTHRGQYKVEQFYHYTTHSSVVNFFFLTIPISTSYLYNYSLDILYCTLAFAVFWCHTAQIFKSWIKHTSQIKIRLRRLFVFVHVTACACFTFLSYTWAYKLVTSSSHPYYGCLATGLKVDTPG